MKHIKFLAGVALGLAAVAPAGATILTFDIDNTRPTDVIAMDQNYGDRVLAAVQGNATYGVGAEGFTGNILASYATGTDSLANLTRWTTDYGDLVNVLENEEDGDTLLSVILTADSGFLAQLYGFDLGGWPNSDYTIAGVSVFDGATQLFSQSNVLVQGDVTGPRHTSFTFATPLSGANLQIRIDLTGLGGNSDNIGIDNIRFGQDRAVAGGVPEPATWATMIAGFGLVGGAMRRRRGTATAIA